MKTATLFLIGRQRPGALRRAEGVQPRASLRCGPRGGGHPGAVTGPGDCADPRSGGCGLRPRQTQQADLCHCYGETAQTHGLVVVASDLGRPNRQTSATVMVSHFLNRKNVGHLEFTYNQLIYDFVP